MIESTEVKVPLKGIGIRHRARASIALIGNPNTGKSTLFNRLTGLRQTTANFPGVTVEKHQGTVELADSALNLVDLPGVFSLDGTSTDERIAVDVLGHNGHANLPDESGQRLLKGIVFGRNCAHQ